MAATTEAEAPKTQFSFEGPFGKFDQAQLQRGYKVYREVCSACHSMSLVAFRNLGDKGGPFYDPKYPNSNDNPVVKAIAADSRVDDIDTETGDFTLMKSIIRKLVSECTSIFTTLHVELLDGSIFVSKDSEMSTLADNYRCHSY